MTERPGVDRAGTGTRRDAARDLTALLCLAAATGLLAYASWRADGLTGLLFFLGLLLGALGVLLGVRW